MKTTVSLIDNAIGTLTSEQELQGLPEGVKAALLTVAQIIDKQGYRPAGRYEFEQFRMSVDSEKNIELFQRFMHSKVGVAYWLKRVTVHTSPPPSILGEIEHPGLAAVNARKEILVVVYPGVYLNSALPGGCESVC